MNNGGQYPQAAAAESLAESHVAETPGGRDGRMEPLVSKTRKVEVAASEVESAGGERRFFLYIEHKK